MPHRHLLADTANRAIGRIKTGQTEGNCRCIWRVTKAGQRYSRSSMAEHDRFGTGSVMVWGGMLADLTKMMTIWNGALNAS